MAEKYGLAKRVWVWLYEWAGKHLPEDYRDTIWETFLAERIEALQARALPDEYIALLFSEERAGVPWEPGREYRPEVREIRDQR